VTSRDKLVHDEAAAGKRVTGTSKNPGKTGNNTVDQIDARTRSRIAARAADDKKGEDVLILDVASIMGIVECFVITSGSNTRLVRSIVDEVERQVFDQTGEKPRAVEGLRDASWVLLDYGDLVVHVFLDETREYYGLERLWADAAVVPWADSASTAL
jgi:ribosome-associated protein